jgi:hypothetical protein
MKMRSAGEIRTSTTENVGGSALEESADTLVLGDLDEAIHGSLVQHLLGSGLHHKTATDSVEGV